MAANRRFETLESLGVESLSDAPDGVVVRVLEGCSRYFSRNPYRRWFDQLETILTDQRVVLRGERMPSGPRPMGDPPDLATTELASVRPPHGR